MKKYLLLLCVIFSITVSTNAFADNISVIIDGKSMQFNPGPMIENGSTIVPMRAFFEAMGASVNWYDSTKTVVAVRDSVNIRLRIGDIECYVNNNKKYLTVKPQIINEKTFVPLRFISEALGAEVDWNGSTKTITIKDKTRQALSVFKLVDAQKYKMRTIYEFTNNGDEVDAEFTILLGAVSNSSYQTDSSIDVNPVPDNIFNDDYNNSFAEIKVDDIKPGQVINIIVTKDLSNSGIEYSIDQNKVPGDYSNLSGYNIYKSPQPKIESDNVLIINKANELAGLEKNPYKIAKNTYGFVNQYLTYDTSEKYAWKGALSALQTKRGVCEEFSKLFVALLRAKGIPSRSVYGYWLQDTDRSGVNYDTWTDIDDKLHEWPEFYIPNYGWIISEPTFAYTYNGEKAIPWYQFANQKSNGHIIYGYENNVENAVKWKVRGYGELKLETTKMSTEIKKEH